MLQLDRLIIGGVQWKGRLVG